MVVLKLRVPENPEREMRAGDSGRIAKMYVDLPYAYSTSVITSTLILWRQRQIIPLQDLHPGPIYDAPGIKTWITRSLAGKGCDAWVREDGTIMTRTMKHSSPTIVIQ